MHIDLVKVWIFPNSTVCISLLEQIFEKHQKSFDELLLFTMLRNFRVPEVSILRS